MEQKFHVGIKTLILNEKNEILILKSNPEDFIIKPLPQHGDLPGGRIKGNDSIEETLCREVEEELGIKNIEILELFDVLIANFNIPLKNETVGLLLVVYRCKIPDNDVKFELDSENLEYKWASIDEAKKLLSFKYPESFIQKLDFLKQQ
jgi:8-oxo-dGTP pyrophosphatase MutT (NUDIX family)